MKMFRIIAIKTGPNGDSPGNFKKKSRTGVTIDTLKNIKPNTVYRFCNFYNFPNKDFSEITVDPSRDFNLCSITPEGLKPVNVNISAVVGENGSGKSSLIELFYWMNYNLGCKFDLLKDADGEEFLMNNFFQAEILYSIKSDELIILKFNKETISQTHIDFSDRHYLFSDNKYQKEYTIKKISDLKDFFYSLVINYSQYALNALEIGEWIKPLFHKNDGYQTPIVLNPMRNDGNIDINKETQLLSRRLQANVLEKYTGDINKSFRNLGNDKIATEFECTYDREYSYKIHEESNVINVELKKVIKSEIEKCFKFKIREEVNVFYGDFVGIALDYIYYKLYKMVYHYPVYIEYREENESLSKIDELIKQIKASDSHTIFKIKGAILHLKYFDKIYKSTKIITSPFLINIDELSAVFHNEISKNEKFYVNTFMMALPPFFKVDIQAADLRINSLSSGEKQKIYSISSIVYHIINLNSVEERKLQKGNKFASYGYINLILDEIELYYHPEWQRMYIDDLISGISKITPQNLKNIKGINIMFVTHSPFILSDIPNYNILKLSKGNSEPFNEAEQTFGANIHDLLTNEFFMKNGYMGEFAKNKIKDLITYLEFENAKKQDDTTKPAPVGNWSKDSSGKVIELIGEPLIKNNLLDFWHIVFSQKDGLN